jgi:hypothetical protein
MHSFRLEPGNREAVVVLDGERQPDLVLPVMFRLNMPYR